MENSEEKRIGAAMAKLRRRLANYKTEIWVLAIFLAFLVLIALGLWRFGWAWTGFLQYTTETTTTGNTTIEIHPSKTLWDVLELVIIPAVLAIGAFLLNRAQHRKDLALEKLREQDAALQGYIDRMTELILEHGLGKSKPGHAIEQYLDEMKRLLFEGELDQSKEASLRDELWSGLSNKSKAIARTLTLTTLRRLNGKRKGILLRFLYEAELILVKEDCLAPCIVLRNADLTEADLSGAFLSGADLTGVNLSGAILTQADLSESILTDVNLAGAKMVKAYLRKSDLAFANLSVSCLKKADLYGANLQSIVGEADLRKADLRDADLRGADLCKARLRGTRLEGAIYDDDTVWPTRFTPPPGAIRTES